MSFNLICVRQDGQRNGATGHHASRWISGRSAALPAAAGQVAAVAGQDRQEGVQSPGGGSCQLGSESRGFYFERETLTRREDKEPDFMLLQEALLCLIS